MKKCLTKQLLIKEVSGCLVEEPECGFVHKFGFSFLCCHPDHATFHAHVAGTLTREEILEQYNALRQKRRDEFMASQDEDNRAFFSSKTDFFGQPVADSYMDGSQQLSRQFSGR